MRQQLYQLVLPTQDNNKVTHLARGDQGGSTNKFGACQVLMSPLVKGLSVPILVCNHLTETLIYLVPGDGSFQTIKTDLSWSKDHFFGVSIFLGYVRAMF